MIDTLFPPYCLFCVNQTTSLTSIFFPNKPTGLEFVLLKFITSD